jgi:hypothetical protein
VTIIEGSGLPPFLVEIGDCFGTGFCSCLIHQAQLPNKLGNYIDENSKVKRQNNERAVSG